VNDLAFDAASGYLYAVGDEGLAVWDGTHWEGFTSAELGFLPDDPLTAVAVESGTTIWVGAKEVWDTSVDWWVATYIGGGLAIGDWQEETWEQYQAPDHLLSNQINDLTVDAGGKLWVASGLFGNEPTAGGISCRDSDGNWKHWGFAQGLGWADLDSLDGYAYVSLVISPDGRVYAGGRHGVSVLDPGADEWQQIEEYSAQQLSLDVDGNLWIAARQGVYRLNSNDAPQNVYEDPESGSWKAVALDEEGNLWFGGAAGLFRVWGGSVQQLYVPDALPGLRVFDVAVNGDDTIWLRSEGWISQLVGDRLFTYASENLAIEAAYPWAGRDSLWPVAPDGTLWFLDDGALRGYNADGWQNVPLDIPSDTYVSGYTACGNDTLVVAVYTGLHLHLINQGWLFVPFPQEAYAIRNLICNGLTNTIWGNLAIVDYFYTGKVGQYELVTGEWTTFSEDNGSMPYVPPYGVSLSPTGEIWAVNYEDDFISSSSVWVYQDYGAWKLIIPWTNFLGESGFGEIYFGNSEDLWLTTMEQCGFESVCLTGLIYYNYNWVNWRWFTEENSALVSERIYDLSVDSQGNAWLATDSGLQRVPLP
jgi:streptogramin lyase